MVLSFSYSNSRRLTSLRRFRMACKRPHGLLFPESKHNHVAVAYRQASRFWWQDEREQELLILLVLVVY